MGANNRTYKFALAGALLAFARAEREDVPLDELVVPYAMSLLEHLKAGAPQASEALKLGDLDFLSVLEREGEASKVLGRPTELLSAAAARSMPEMVMQKFHNLRGGVEVPDRFYEISGPARHKLVVLSPALRRSAQSPQALRLDDEIGTRWAIVESSFMTGIGRSLIDEGVAVDLDTLTVTDRHRRRPIAGVTEAVLGFQHGRFLICDEVIGLTDLVAVDHVFPMSMMDRGRLGGWNGPDLDLIWNLAPSHDACNNSKSARPPKALEKYKLAQRNNAIMGSQYPLCTSMRRTLRAGGYSATSPRDWHDFLDKVPLYL
jgi:hypothetical protein